MPLSLFYKFCSVVPPFGFFCISFNRGRRAGAELPDTQLYPVINTMCTLRGELQSHCQHDVLFFFCEGNYSHCVQLGDWDLGIRPVWTFEFLATCFTFFMLHCYFPGGNVFNRLLDIAMNGG